MITQKNTKNKKKKTLSVLIIAKTRHKTQERTHERNNKIQLLFKYSTKIFEKKNRQSPNEQFNNRKAIKY